MPIFSALPSLAQVPAFDRHGNTAVASVTAMQAVLAATFFALCPRVQAQLASPEPTYGLGGRIGLGVATVPTYEGSPNRRMLAGPELTLSYRSLLTNASQAGP